MSTTRVGYVLKRYPRYSETFIVNEILAHEEAELPLSILALRPPSDSHFQDSIARVRAAVTYIPHDTVRASAFWDELRECAREFDVRPLLDEPDAHVARQSLYVARAVREQGIGHLHAHFGSVATSVARLAGRLTGVPYTFTAHAKDIFHESVVTEDLDRKLRDAAAVVTVSDFNARHLARQHPDAKDKVRRIYNGLELERFPYAKPSDRSPLVLGIGRLVQKKGFATLVAACALLADSGRDFYCEIIGGGELEADLRERIERAGLSKRVQLVGLRPQLEVARRIREAAVVAAPCVLAADGNRDGLPTTLLEAMASGTPCVATPVTGIPEVVHDGETGLLVPEHDASALAAAIGRLLDDSALRCRLAVAARRRIEADFDVRASTRRLRRVFAGARLRQTESGEGAP